MIWGFSEVPRFVNFSDVLKFPDFSKFQASGLDAHPHISILYDVILSLHAMFEDPDNAMNVYATYKKTYKKFGGDSISTTDANQFNKFFKI